MIPLGALRASCAVHLGHDQRHVGVHAPRRGVVDDDRSGGGELRGVGPRRRGPRRRTGRCRARSGRPSRRPRRRCRPPSTAGWSRPIGTTRSSASRSTGNLRSASRRRMTLPTWPVAPTTPMRIPGSTADMAETITPVTVMPAEGFASALGGFVVALAQSSPCVVDHSSSRGRPQAEPASVRPAATTSCAPPAGSSTTRPAVNSPSSSSSPPATPRSPAYLTVFGLRPPDAEGRVA